MVASVASKLILTILNLGFYLIPCTASPFVMKTNILISNRVQSLFLVSFKGTFNLIHI